MKVNYKPVPVLDEKRKPLHRIQTRIEIGTTTIYKKPCISVCNVVNYDAFPGTFFGKGCCGFLGYLPMMISGVVTAGFGLAATAVVYTCLAEEDRNADIAVAIGAGASVLLGSISSAIACYRSSMCCCGTDKIKYRIERKSGERAESDNA